MFRFHADRTANAMAYSALTKPLNIQDTIIINQSNVIITNSKLVPRKHPACTGDWAYNRSFSPNFYSRPRLR